MRARKGERPDPIVGAWERLLAADKAAWAADRARDRATARARAKSFRVDRPTMTVGMRGCLSVEEVKRAARESGFTPTRQRELAAAMKKRLADWRQQRKAAGLEGYDRTLDNTTAEWHSAMKALTTTKATTPRGVILKLRYVERGIRDGHNPFDAEVIKSAIADLSRLGLVAGFRGAIEAKRKRNARRS